MKRHPGLVPISHEHRQLLFAAQILKRGAPRFRDAPATAAAKLAFARRCAAELLVPHQQREEALLFPVAADAGLGEMVGALLVDHQAIDAALAHLAGVETEAPELEAQLDSLGQLLEAHVRAEERGLFPQLQATLSDEALRAIGERWRAAAGPSCTLSW